MPIWILLPAALIILFLLIFFRDPERTPDGDGMLSPADGKVRSIDGRAVSIFMNLHNVHVNRAPLAGNVKSIKYEKGAFSPAFLGEAGKNENNKITLATEHGGVTVTQIAGFFARRIVCYVSEGENVTRGQRIGMIRFGSRVDVTVPENFKILISTGDKVKAGKTVIAKLEV
jgi:phosphatidylserine decarboxylase